MIFLRVSRGVAQAASLFLFVGCATITGDIKSPLNAVFKRELEVKVNGKVYSGTGVLPKSERYTMVITSRVDVDKFSVTSCHRDFEINNAIDVTWIKPKRSYEFIYEPVKGIEDEGSCIVKIAAFNKGKAANSFAMFEFEDTFYQLPAKVNCNGDSKQYGGVSFCQAKDGLVQTITFEKEVKIDNTDPNCKPYEMKTSDNKTFEFQMPLGECVFTARELVGEKKFHRHMNFGYNDYVQGAE